MYAQLAFGIQQEKEQKNKKKPLRYKVQFHPFITKEKREMIKIHFQSGTLCHFTINVNSRANIIKHYAKNMK